MAIVRAVKSGNWSDTTVWNTGALPTSADDVYSNTFTVTIDISPTVLSISNAATTGVTAGGGFDMSANGITLTCTGAGVVASGNLCLSVTVGSGSSCTVNGNCLGGTVSNATGVRLSGVGTLTVNGNVNSGTVAGTNGVHNTSSGTVNIFGNCTATVQGGSVSSTAAANNSSSGTMNIVGDCANNSTQSGHNAVINTFGIMNITGSCTSGGTQTGVVNGTGTLNITGSVTGAVQSNNVTTVVNGSTGTLNINGTIIGGVTSTNYAVVNSSTGTFTHIGTAQASVASAIGPGVVGQITRLSGPLLSSDATFAGAAASGVNPCVAVRWFPLDTALSTFEYRVRGQTASTSERPARQLFLTDAYSASYPATNNVSFGSTYGPAGIYTGTMYIPNVQNVGLGVSVGTTTGTALFTAGSVWDAPVTGISSAGSIGNRLKNAATIDNVSVLLRNVTR